MSLTDADSGLVLADSSVWIEVERGVVQVIDIMRNLVSEDRILIAGPVMAEVLVGSPNPKLLTKEWSSLHLAPTDSAAWHEAAALRRITLETGHSVQLIDCLIAALAIREVAEIYTLDRDFSRIPGVKLYEPQ